VARSYASQDSRCEVAGVVDAWERGRALRVGDRVGLGGTGLTDRSRLTGDLHCQCANYSNPSMVDTLEFVIAPKSPPSDTGGWTMERRR
jgi:hypothetical protein